MKFIDPSRFFDNEEFEVLLTKIRREVQELFGLI
jgi:hypothetical protein